MQESLFGNDDNAPEKRSNIVAPVAPHDELVKLAAALPERVRLGTSSWHYPGWDGLVWQGEYAESVLSRQGLTAYSQYPLFRTVSIDRGFYRPLTVSQYAEHAGQVTDDFRFVVKAPSLITDALVRNESGKGMRSNPQFLNAAETLQLFVEPALDGLGKKLGALVFQISPLPIKSLNHISHLIEQLYELLAAIPKLQTVAPDGVIAVEVRDPQWLTQEFVNVLRMTGATYCMGLHAKMPRIAEQLPILRALWPGPLVCRWNLNPLHGAYGYEDARDLYSPFDKIIDPDLETRAALARVISGTANGGQNVYVTVSNKAEGSAPLSVIELARAVCG
ncbi:MAG: DUF72 domain-containing protein [Cellvibrionaceae bacterium]|nr:DUF72 domain-containing protein [Cellvibrionaceae bacterium]